ncbi:hypothetical protein MUP01_10880 [Candidatus Bathyarchaeota archaeon]|nr:hypothetical protein [Candidatus Bathyarchaeota archaeon]
MSETEKAYWAGFIDAEGAIGITKQKNEKHVLGFAYTPYASVTNTNLKILELLKQRFGGRIHKHNSKTFKNGKDLYIWYINAKSMKEFIYTIEPYLKMKKEQAQIICNYIHKRSQYYKSYVPKIFWEIAEQAYQRLKVLNKRGIA